MNDSSTDNDLFIRTSPRRFPLGFGGVKLLLLALLAAVAVGATARAQPRHRLLADDNRFLMQELSTGVKRPFDMWVVRLANACFDQRFTDAVIANLDDYKRYGVNTLVVSIQGGGIGYATYPTVYNPDGTRITASPVWARLLAIMEETDRRGMALFIQYWYFEGDEQVPDDAKALLATRNVTLWLKSTGYQHYLLDVVNEFGHGAFYSRPLFTTDLGALQIVDAVQSENPDVMVGISPPSRIMAPTGTLQNPTRTVTADIIIGHNQICEPSNPGCYRFGPQPAGWKTMPYVNNEFWSQTTYERTLRTNPRTGLDSYGHFDQATVDLYMQDLATLRAFGGFGNIHCQYHQRVVKNEATPLATVGPEGTQPESTTPGEPSLHWLYRSIASLRGFGPLPMIQDFNAGYASGAELDLDGTWQTTGGYLVQTDGQAAPGWCRLVADTGDVEIAVDGGFVGTPGSGSCLGIQLGNAALAGPAYRVRVYADRVVLDKPGLPFTAQSAPAFKLHQDQYRLRVAGGRIQVRINGQVVLDVADAQPVAGRNLHLLTEGVDARFDNLRITPLRHVDFEDSRTGAWTTDDPQAFSVVAHGASNQAWQAVVPANETRRALLDWKLEDISLAATVDLSAAPSLGVHLRSTDLSSQLADGYHVEVWKDGTVTLDRRDQGQPLRLASGRVTVANPASIQLEVWLVGNHVVVSLDGQAAIDAIDPGIRFARGPVAILTRPGTTVLDDLHLNVAPGRFPIARFLPFTGPALPQGFSFEFGDPDGILDVQQLALYLNSDGHTFVDVTFLLIPTFGVFSYEFPPDGRCVRFRLNGPVPIGPVNWILRVEATDRDGRRTVTDLKL